MPLVNKTFDQLLDFTRTSAATFVGSDGLIQLTPASRNLLTFTQQFDNAAWNKSNATVTANTAVAPDDTSTADTVTASATLGLHLATQAITVTNATAYTASFFVKAAGYSKVGIREGNLTGAYATFNLATGTKLDQGTGGVGTITAVGNGWYRIDMVSTSGGTSFRADISILDPTYTTGAPTGTWTADGTSGIYVWGAQVEAASAVTTYTRNNGGRFPPRFDYDPVTLAAKGLLIEEQRTNLLLNSVFSGAVSGNPGTVPTSWTYTSPNGPLTVTSLGRNFACNSLRFAATADRNYMAQTVTVAATGTYVLSANINVFTAVQLIQLFQFNPLPAGATVQYIYNGVNQASSYSPPTGTGLLQAIITTTGTGGALGIRVGVGCSSAITGDVSFQDIQIELGAFATSYIPTVASQVTRTGDSTAIVAPNFAPWYNQSEGTFVVEASTLSGGNLYRAALVARASGGIADRIDMAIGMGKNGAAGIFRDEILVGGVAQASLGDNATFSGNTAYKGALAYKVNDFASATSGGNLATDVSGTVPTVALLDIGNRNGISQTNGHIRSIRYYPVRLSDTQIQALTA